MTAPAHVLTAHQPVYLPWLGLFHKIALAETYVFLDTVKYLKQDWNNRNQIKTASGPQWLTVPVATRGSDRVILKDVRVANEHKWQHKHWKTIVTAYSRAPYFEDYAELLAPFYNSKKPWGFLVDVNEAMLRLFLHILAIPTRVVKASDYQFRGHKSSLIVDICQQLKASIYLFGAQGVQYADRVLFEAHGITPVFQAYQYPTYPQLHGTFCSHLSIIDLLFNCGPDSLKILMSGNISQRDVTSDVPMMAGRRS